MNSVGDAGETNGHCDQTPQTHEEWTAFAALPDYERAEVYLRSLPMALLLFAVALVGR